MGGENFTDSHENCHRHPALTLLMPHVDWPEGTAVEVIPLQQQIGITEDDWPTTSDGIQSLLNRMDEAAPGDDEPINFLVPAKQPPASAQA